MNCEEIQDNLTLYVLGDLDGPAGENVRRHLDECGNCRAVLRDIETTLGLLRNTLAATAPVPARLEDARRAKLLSRQKPRPAVMRWIVEPHHALALAASVLFVAGFLWLLVPTLRRPRGAALMCMGAGVPERAVQVRLIEPEPMEQLEEIKESDKLPEGPLGTFNAGASENVGPAGGFVASLKDRGGAPLLDTDGNGVADAWEAYQPAEPETVEGAGSEAATIKSPVVFKGLFGSRSAGRSQRALKEYGGAVAGAGDFMALEPELRTARELQVREAPPTAGLPAAPDEGELAKGKEVLEKLESVKIPELDFRQANIRDVVAFLEEASVEFDESAARRGDRGVSMELALGPRDSVPAPAEVEDVFADSADQEAVEPGTDVPLITFNARNISALEALKIATSVANLKYRVENGRIVVVPFDAPASEVVTRIYNVPSGLPAALEERLPQRAVSAAEEEDVGGQLTEFFSEMGVRWPAGSSLKYEPAAGKLIAANTADNLEVLEKTLNTLTAAPETEPEAAPVFRAVGVNPFVAAAERPFSTFAIDVDTASYTLARTYMLQGHLPPAEAVRTEEFVNSFDYDYPPPRQHTFEVYGECAPSEFGQGLYLLKLGVKARRLGREEQRRAVLTFVIDTSGSMETPDRLALVKLSLRMLVDRLRPDDRVAIVQFGSEARLVLEHTPAARKEIILQAVDRLQTTGSTNLEEGTALGYEVAARGFTGGAANRVLILTDGAANLGAGAAGDILAKVGQFRRQGIYCGVFGFGIGTYNDVMLETLANRGDGAYVFIDSEEEARRVFVDELAATLNTVAADVKIQVEFNPRLVARYRQLGYENRQLTKEQFRDDTVDAGEVGSGQSATALYELDLGRQPAGRRAASAVEEPVAIVRVRYRRTDTGAVEEIERRVLPSDIRASFGAASVRFRLAAAVAEFAEILRGSPHSDGDCRDVAAVLRPVALDLNLDRRVRELLGLVEAAPGLPRAGLSGAE